MERPIAKGAINDNILPRAVLQYHYHAALGAQLRLLLLPAATQQWKVSVTAPCMAAEVECRVGLTCLGSVSSVEIVAC